jgi:hypothetical protein
LKEEIVMTEKKPVTVKELKAFLETLPEEAVVQVVEGRWCGWDRDASFYDLDLEGNVHLWDSKEGPVLELGST